MPTRNPKKSNNSPAFVYLGLASLQLDQLADAEAAFRQALILDPGSAQAHYNLGLTYSRQNRVPEAIRALEKAVTLAPQQQTALYNLGVLLLDQKRPEEAVRYLERARQAGTETAELAVNLIRAHLDL